MLRFIRFYGQERYIQNTKKYSVPGGQHNRPSSLFPINFWYLCSSTAPEWRIFQTNKLAKQVHNTSVKEKTLCTEEPRRQNESAQRARDYKQV